MPAAEEEESAAIFAEEGTAPHLEVVGGRARRFRRAAAIAATASVGFALAAVAVGHGHVASPMEATGVTKGQDLVELAGFIDVIVSAADGASTAARLVKDGQKGYEDAASMWEQLSAPEREAAKEILKEGKLKNLTEHFAHLKGQELYPKNNQNDGNPCPDGEEMHLGECYTRCADLTGGLYPIRTAAFACCMQEPCSFFNTHFSNPLKLCAGLDVAGRVRNPHCPHMEGDCLINEEFNFGICYKKCGILTKYEYPYRFGPDSCCKYKNHLACFDPVNVNTSLDFNVGGGAGDDELTNLSIMHLPIPALAEVQTTTTWPALPVLPVPPSVQIIPQTVAQSVAVEAPMVVADAPLAPSVPAPGAADIPPAVFVPASATADAPSAASVTASAAATAPRPDTADAQKAVQLSAASPSSANKAKQTDTKNDAQPVAATPAKQANQTVARAVRQPAGTDDPKKTDDKDARSAGQSATVTATLVLNTDMPSARLTSTAASTAETTATDVESDVPTLQKGAKSVEHLRDPAAFPKTNAISSKASAAHV